MAGVVIQETGDEFLAGEDEQALGLGGGVLEGFVVIGDGAALAVVPMGNSVDGGVFIGPLPEVGLQFGGGDRRTG